jgi:hypothetical protein
VRADVAVARGVGRLRQGEHSARFGYAVVTAGLAVPWQLRIGRASLLAGPRLSALWLERRFDLALAPGGRSWFTVSPGVLLGVRVPVGPAFSLGAELHVDYSVVRVDGENRSSGLGELLVGAGYRF